MTDDQLAALRLDAARYQFLRHELTRLTISADRLLVDGLDYSVVRSVRARESEIGALPESVDAAVDAAIKDSE